MRGGPYRFDLIFENAHNSSEEQVTIIADDGEGYLRIQCQCEGGFTAGPCPHLQTFAQKFPSEKTQTPWKRLEQKYWKAHDTVLGDCGRKLEN